MKVLASISWLDELSAELSARGLAVELVGFDERHTGPFGGAEVFFRGEGARNWKEVLDRSPDVRWFHTTAAGVDSFLETTRRGASC